MDEHAPRIEIPHVDGYNCFGCGTTNEHGLHMRFYKRGEAVMADVTLSRDQEGWQRMAHGGIISTLLDEIMAWTIIVRERVFAVTRRMTVEYHAPVPVEAPLTVVGRMTGEEHPRGAVVEGEILDGEGTRLASARGEFYYLPEDRLAMVPQRLKDDMKALFESLERLARTSA